MHLIDKQGLLATGRSTTEEADEAYIRALRRPTVSLSLPSDAIDIQPEERMGYLKRLAQGVNVYVYTGPEGAAFWLPVSIEVHVVIVPDGYEYKKRNAADMVWALQVYGVSPSKAAMLVNQYGNKSPTQKHKLFTIWQMATALCNQYAEHVQGTSIVVNEQDITVITDPNEQLNLLSTVTLCALDYEWDVDTLQPDGLSVATADHTWYLPVVAADYEEVAGQGERIREAVRNLVHRTPTVWHNAKADIGTQWPLQPLDAFGADIHDTLVMAYLAGENALGLKDLTRKYLHRDPLGYPGSMRLLPLATASRYGGADARNTYDLFGILWNILDTREQLGIYLDIEKPIIPLLADMERNGHPINIAMCNQLITLFATEMEEIHTIFWQEEQLDISKDKDTRELVRRRVGYDPGSCNKDALAKIPYDWMTKVLRYRQLRHQKRGFLEKHIARWEQAGKPDDFRLYTSFNQAGLPDSDDSRSFKRAPRSGRLSSSGGVNLQNQPASIRDIFCAPDGYVIWCMDYSQLEYRIGAAMSGDKAMIDDINSGDPHAATQLRIKELTGVDIGRTAAKGVNFGGSYGGHVDALRRTLARQRAFMDEATMQAAVNTRKEAYPDYYAYGERIVEFGKLSGYAETYFGRRRYDEAIQSSDKKTVDHVGRAFINHALGQGTAADMLKQAMVLAVPVCQKYGAHIAIQAHDELEGWVAPAVAVDFLKELTATLASVTVPGISFPISCGYGATWGEAKDNPISL